MNKGGIRRIRYLRRASQIFFFILLMYGLVLLGIFVRYFDVQSEPINDLATVNENISQTYRYAADYNLPARSCSKISGDNRIFQGCALRFLSEKMTMGALWDFLPQILFVLIILIVLGRMICGWVCPIGFISEVMTWLRQKLHINEVKLSERTKDFLSKFKYYLLATIVIISLAVTIPFLGGNVIRKEFYQLSCQFCPSKIIFGLIPGGWNLYLDFTTPLFALFTGISIVFAVMIALSFFIPRFWCRVCPNGAMISLFSKASLVQKEKDVRKCTKCAICKRVCPTGNDEVYLEKDKKNINTQDCVMCFECVDKCPEDDCLKVKFLHKTIFRSRFKK